jgi:hypothetical protein
LAGASFRGQVFKTRGDRHEHRYLTSHRQGDGLDIKPFPQRADANQGRSTQGKADPAMARAGAANPGTFCCSQPS